MSPSVHSFCSGMAVFESNKHKIDDKTKDVLRKSWSRYSDGIDKHMEEHLFLLCMEARDHAAPFIAATSWSDVHKAFGTLKYTNNDSTTLIHREINEFIRKIIDEMGDIDDIMAQVSEFENQEQRTRFAMVLLQAYSDLGMREVDNMIENMKKVIISQRPC